MMKKYREIAKRMSLLALLRRILPHYEVRLQPLREEDHKNAEGNGMHREVADSQQMDAQGHEESKGSHGSGSHEGGAVIKVHAQ